MIDMGVVPAVAQYAEELLSKEGFRHVSAVVANCKMLAAELEGQGSEEGSVDMDALIIAGYLHDISTASHGFQNHHVKSAEMAVEFLRELDAPAELISKVEQAILAHAVLIPALAPTVPDNAPTIHREASGASSFAQSGREENQRETMPLEGRILYDADKLGRLSGLAVVTSLIEFGARYPNRAVTGEVLAAILRHIEERFVELYQSLNTAPARELAKTKFGNTLAFLDGVIEHLADATPV